MAFPKGKSKKIMVDNKDYEYAVSGHTAEDHNWHCIKIYINNNTNSTKASFELVFKRHDELTDDVKLPIIPSLIEAIIRSNNI